jgi:hypothetical protein
MNAHDEVQLWHALYRLEARYWHEVDSNCGRNAHEFYVPDGLMVVGHNHFEGREKIREYYAWRQCQVTTGICSQTTRHLISNLFIESCDGWCVKVMGIVSFYGASGRPPAPQSKPPILVADLINECILDDESRDQLNICETARYGAVFERPSYLTRLRRTGWLGGGGIRTSASRNQIC